MNVRTYMGSGMAKRARLHNFVDVILFSLGLFLTFRINAFLAGNAALANESVFAGRENIFTVAIVLLYVAAYFYFTSRFRNYGLTTRLIIAFVVVSFITALGINQIVSRTVRSSLTESVGAYFVAQTGSLRSEINLYLHEKVGQLRALALADTLKDALEQRNSSYVGSTQDILGQIQTLDEQWRTAADDDPLIRLVVEPDDETNPAGYQLYDYLEEFPAHAEIFVTDRYGATLASTGRLTDYYQADETWWQAAWNDGAGAIYISDPEYDKSAGVTALLIALPIYSEENGEILGIVRSTLAVAELYDLVAALQLGATGHALLMDSNGEIVFEPDTERGVDSSELPDGLRRSFIVQDAAFSIAQSESGNESVFGYSPLHSDADLSSGVGEFSSPLTKAIHSLGWVVVIRQDTTEALATLTRISQVIQLASFVVLIGAAILGFLVARYLAKPIKQLSLAVQTVGAGDLDAPLPAPGKDEVGLLVTHFGQMISQLKATLENLQGRNRDLDLAVEIGRELTRTRELTAMLNDSVEIIRDRFQLYYAQIYLLDPSGRHLILRAGTGEPGRLLVQRGHRLVLGGGSLNGLAAVRRTPVVVADTDQSELHRPNPLLPETRFEMVIPLIAGDDLVGVLDLQSDKVDHFSEDSVASFTALAAQLAIAIQNARLFSETQQARMETEQYAQRLLRRGWQSFLNALDREEKLVTAYGLTDETPSSAVSAMPADQESLTVPIQLAGVSVGQIRLEDNAERGWTEHETSILQAVAEKMASQIENLRLLAEADQYRQQAEEAARRLLRENWQTYLATSQKANLSYVYDQTKVTVLDEALPAVELKQVLQVDGEPIGELQFSGVEALGEKARSLLQQIVARASNRLWTLHLVEQAERALNMTEEQAERLRRLNELGNALSETQTMDEAFATVAQHIGGIIGQARLSASLLDRATASLDLFAVDGRPGPIALELTYPVAGTAIGECVTQQKIIRVPDLTASNYLESRDLIEQGLRSTLLVPLISGRTALGTLNMASENLAAFTEQDEALLLQIAPLLASTIESQRLYTEARDQAQRERLLNNIGQKIRGTVTLENALQTAIEEMARALDVPFAQLRMSTGKPAEPVERLSATNGLDSSRYTAVDANED